VPNRRNWWHQKFCFKPECRKASKAQSQRRWLSQPENRDVFRGSENVERVRQWRAKNPGYWKRSPKGQGTLQEVFPAQVPENTELKKRTSLPPLQDFRRVARSSAVGAYRTFAGLTVTRGRGTSHPAPATKRPKHSGHEVWNETERQYVCR